MFGIEIDPAKLCIGNQVERGSSSPHDRRGRVARRTVSMIKKIHLDIKLCISHKLFTSHLSHSFLK